MLVRRVFRWDGGAFAVALAAAACFVYVIGFHYGAFLLNLPVGQEASWMDSTATVALVAGVAVVAVVFYGAANLLFAWFDSACAESAQAGAPLPLRTTLRSHFWKTFLLLVCCWLPWFIAHLPGTFDDDTIWQLVIWRTPSIWSDHHPWATTALFGWVCDLGRDLAGTQSAGIVVLGIVQLVCAAAVFSLTFCYLRRFRVSKVLLVGCLVAVCIVPVYASFASELVKDSVFSWPWLLFLLAYFELVRTRGHVLAGRAWLWAALLGVAVLLVFSKKTGVYLVVPSLIILVALVPGFRLRVVALAAVVAMVFVVWSAVLLPAWGVAPGSSGEVLSAPLQQTARVVTLHADELSDDERAAIAGVLPFDRLAQVYLSDTADPVKALYESGNADATATWLRTWASLGLRYPLDYLLAVMGTNTGLYSPLSAFQLKNNMDTAFVEGNVRFFSGTPIALVEAEALEQGADPDAAVDGYLASTAEGLSSWPVLEPFKWLMNTYEWLIGCTPLRLAESLSIVGLWVPFVALCYGMRTRSGFDRSVLVCLVPALLFLLTLVVSPTTVSRYFAPAAFATPLIACFPFVMASYRARVERR